MAEKLSDEHLLEWINGSIQADFENVGQLGSGVAYAQLLDMLFENCVEMTKVNFKATQPDEFTGNWKVLEKGLKKIGEDKFIPIQDLVTGKREDNEKFAQWFKMFFDANYYGQDYDPLGARGGVALPPGATHVEVPLPNLEGSSKPMPAPDVLAKSTDLGVLTKAADDLRENIDRVEKERDFYFGKLRDVEVLCHTDLDSDLSHRVLDVLYAVDMDDGYNHEERRAVEVDNSRTAEVKFLRAELAELKTNLLGLEEEKNFYVGKVKAIEAMVEDSHGERLADTIMNILFAEEEGFAPADAKFIVPQQEAILAHRTLGSTTNIIAVTGGALLMGVFMLLLVQRRKHCSRRHRPSMLEERDDDTHELE